MSKLWPSSLTHICVSYVLITGTRRANWTSKWIKLHLEWIHTYLCSGIHQFAVFDRWSLIPHTKRANRQQFGFRFHVTDTIPNNLYLLSLGWGKLMVMMTSLNGNIFRTTRPLWGESTGYRWIPLTKAGGTGLWFFLYTPGEMVEETIGTPV